KAVSSPSPPAKSSNAAIRSLPSKNPARSSAAPPNSNPTTASSPASPTAPAKASSRTRGRWDCLNKGILDGNWGGMGSGTPMPVLIVARCFMRLCCVILLSAVAGCAARQTESPMPPSDPHSLRVLTYNVNFGGVAMDQATAAIAEADADIVCLQETTPAWEQILRGDLSTIYPHMEFHHSGGAGGQAFLSKLQLQEVAYVTETPGWFPGWIVNAKTRAGMVQLINVYLRPRLTERGSVTASAYLGTGVIRREEVRLLSDKVDP